MQFLRQEKINHSTFSKWRRRYQAENLEVVKSEETLAPVSISHTNCNNVIQPFITCGQEWSGGYISMK